MSREEAPLKGVQHERIRMPVNIIAALKRKKIIYSQDDNQLARILTLKDLVSLGVGSALGLGVWIIAGQVAKSQAGPGVCLSFLVAAVVSAFAGLCYAEFAGRVPRAGYTYIYSYVSLGEGIAFVIGWNMILGLILCVASISRGLSSYIDALADNTIKNTLLEWLPMHMSVLSPYPDLVALMLVLLLTALFSLGLKASSRIQNLFTVLNLLTVIGAVIAASTSIDIKNWNIPLSEIDQEYRREAGEGGFLPFGVTGVLAGAPSCFFGYAGFDAAATAGGEAKYPRRDIPRAILISLAIVFIVYCSLSVVLTLALPYYLQSNTAPFPRVFEELGWHTIKWVVTIGAIFSIFSCFLGAMYPLPRLIYAMAKDGLIFKTFGQVNERTKTPLVATVSSGLVAGIMAAVINLDQLIDLMTIGGLLSYSIVAMSVIVLRYEPMENIVESPFPPKYEVPYNYSMVNILDSLLNLNNAEKPTPESSCIVNWSIQIYSLMTVVFCTTIIYGSAYIPQVYYAVLLVVTFILMVAPVIVTARQPTQEYGSNFKVPLLPYIPCLSVIFNTFLMLQLNLITWMWFIIWILIGFVVYYFYGISHSEANVKKGCEKMPAVALQDENVKL